MNKNDSIRVRTLGAALALATLAAAAPASAAIVAATGTITHINTYPEFGGGDFVFRLSSYVAGCESGFWLAPSQPGFKTTVAFLMQSRAMGESISVAGNTAQIWSGSGSNFCKVDWVAVAPQ